MIENAAVAENIGAVRMKIDAFCREAGRTDRPLLLAATKTVPVEQINFAVRQCRITDVGENKVQELLEKYDALDRSVRLHFIGRLQKNKVKYIVGKVCLIHSVDSVRLLAEIERQSAKKEVVSDVLLEVNTGREPQKGGFFPEQLDEALQAAGDFPHVRVKGLMAVAPVCEKSEDIYNYFEETYQKFIDISGKKLHNVSMEILSMGMTDSFGEAIRAGSTLVRIGSAIFGKRYYENQNTIN